MMKKVIAEVIAVLLLAAGSLWADDADLIVDGKLGVGTGSPGTSLTVINNSVTGGVSLIYGGSSGSGTFTDPYNFLQRSATLAVGSNWLHVNGSNYGLLNVFNADGSALWVGDNGNVGIGTASPNYKLDVGGISAFSDRLYKTSPSPGGVNPALISAQTEWGAGEIPIITLGFEMGATGGTDMSTQIRSYARTPSESANFITIGRGRIDLSAGTTYLTGNVGIGTTSPAQKLTVNGNVSLMNGSGGFGGAITDDGGRTVFSYGWDGVNGNKALLQSPEGGAQILATQLKGIQINGNVGIGTTDPNYKLDVVGQIRSSSGGFVFPDGSTQTTAYSGTASQASYLNTAGLYYQGGNVGIGTTNPQSQLSVGGSGFSSAAIYAYGGSSYGIYADGAVTGVNGSAANYGVYGHSTSSNGAGVEGTSSGSSSYGVYGFSGGASGRGVYGEGTTGVSGYSYAGNGYGIYCYSYSNANGCGGNRPWYNSSDENLKENISTIGDALSKVLQLRGVGFNWKDDADKKHQHGFVAQEAEKIVPEVVGKDMDGNYTMSYGSLVPLLVEAIKEQQKMIDQQNKAIEALQAALMKQSK